MGKEIDITVETAAMLAGLQSFAKTRWGGFALVTTFSLLFLSPTLGRFAGFLDEGLVLSPAIRILQHEVVYRDFYLYTTPAGVYLYALFMLVFGKGTLVTSACLWLIRGLGLGALFLVGRSCLPTKYAILPPWILLATYAHESTNFAAHWTSNLTFLWALFAILWSLKKQTPLSLLIAGVAVATAGMTLQTFGVALLITGCVAFAPQAKKGAWWLLGVALGAAPWFIFLIATGALRAFWVDVLASNVYRAGFEFIKPTTFLGVVAAEFKQGLWYLPVALLLIVPPLVGTLGPLLIARKVRLEREVWVVYTASVLMLALCCYRCLPSQLLMHHFLSVVMMMWVFHRIPRGWYLAAGFSALMLIPGGQYIYNQSTTPRIWVEFPMGPVWVSRESEKASLDELTTFLQSHIPPDTEVQFTPYVPGLYYYLDIPGATRYVQIRSRQYSREQMEEVLTTLRDKGFPKVIHFTIYDSEGFLRANWPDQDPQLYYQQRDWFRDRLKENYKMRDFGALLLFEKKAPESSQL